ncbi:putative ABC transporter permease [Gordonibacter massiliensis]|uniref:Putative ABC transporter permease n=2 Tax=Gordonibacter massiliensis (ex Traore et al. 2017) TaxID=1841863 RepID=A0A842JKT8_9ACTN|nr:putative ABC transporter permease [Gordonibacter massiliensis (ex Traore et al. 2017)]
MAKDFSNPKKLGFMRLLQVFFAFNVIVTIALLVFLVKGNYELGFEDILDFVNLIFDGISFWLIWQRKRLARYFIIGFSLFNIVLGTAFNIATGVFNPADQLLACTSDIILLAYFLTSRRAKAVLTKPFNAEVKQQELSKDINYYQPKTWAFWRNLIIYFCVFSVVGHWMEAGYCTLIRFGLIPGIYDPNSQIWSDWLYPFLVYGFGAVACVLLLYPVKNFLEKHIGSRVVPLIISFVINALVCTLIELAMGLMLNQPGPDGKLPLWDYSDMFCNFMGQVCLQNAVAFGVVATLMTWVIYPALEGWLAKVPRDGMNIAFIAVVVGFCILFFLYCINVLIPGVEVTADDDTGESTIEFSRQYDSDAGA